MSTSALHVFVSGRVQGVAFRWETRRQAAALGVAGWVRNLADGRVEAWLEGEPGSVAELRAWLEQGPPAARVEQVAAADVAPADHADFEIRPTGHG